MTKISVMIKNEKFKLLLIKNKNLAICCVIWFLPVDINCNVIELLPVNIYSIVKRVSSRR